MKEIRVDLERVDDSFHFVARNQQGFEVHIDDATAREDGIGHGAGPMQLLLMGLAGCSGVDVASILAKARQPVERFHIAVTGQRPDGVTPSPYTAIQMHFELFGDLDPGRVERAVRLSVEKYCSAAATLRHAAVITASYAVNGTRYETSISLGPDA